MNGNPVVRAVAALAALAVVIGALWYLPEDYYSWIKAAHVLAIISWMAGMLYLPRLFVYHVDAEIGSKQSETFKIMERRLLRGIINPAMLVAWATGLWMAWRIFGFQGGWLHVKLAAVLALSASHGYLSGALRKFAEDRNDKSARHWRFVNEIPTLLMIVIVVMVIVKPF